MRSNEKHLYVQESEVGPNRYVSIALCLLALTLGGILALNEIGVFMVEKLRMRYCVALSSAFLVFPQLLLVSEKQLMNPRNKYILLMCAQISIFISCSAICFHTFPVLVLPMLLAAQYPSRRMCIIGCAGSVCCAIFAPLHSLLLGFWDNQFLLYLMELGQRTMLTVIPGEPVSTATGVRDVLLFICLPNSLAMISFYPLIRSVSRHAEDRLKNEIQVLHMSESDALTGLLNRHCYERRILLNAERPGTTVTCVYVDANGLHRLNELEGHDGGDKLLCCVAEQMRTTFGDEYVYRIGGDEFVAIADDLETDEARVMMERVRQGVLQAGYSVSIGMERGAAPCSLKPLLLSAEAKMMADKERQHAAR